MKHPYSPEHPVCTGRPPEVVAVEAVRRRRPAEVEQRQRLVHGGLRVHVVLERPQVEPGDERRAQASVHQAHLQEVRRRHRHRLEDVHGGGGGDVDGDPAVDADVEVEGGEPVEPVVVAVVEGGPDEVPAPRRHRPERVAAARGGAALAEVADVAVPVGQALVDVRRADDGVEPLPGVNEAGVGDVEETPRVGVPVAPVLGDAAVDADETRCVY